MTIRLLLVLLPVLTIVGSVTAAYIAARPAIHFQSK
jgi:phage shock protein PspC (stress-responsive transcriptional regulator)